MQRAGLFARTPPPAPLPTRANAVDAVWAADGGVVIGVAPLRRVRPESAEFFFFAAARERAPWPLRKRRPPRLCPATVQAARNRWGATVRRGWRSCARPAPCRLFFARCARSRCQPWLHTAWLQPRGDAPPRRRRCLRVVKAIRSRGGAAVTARPTWLRAAGAMLFVFLRSARSGPRPWHTPRGFRRAPTHPKLPRPHTEPHRGGAAVLRQKQGA